MPRRCGHVFHAECLAEWCKTKGALAASCPLCKRMISDEEEEKRLAAAAAATPTASTTNSSRTDESTDESSPPVGVEPTPVDGGRIATGAARVGRVVVATLRPPPCDMLSALDPDAPASVFGIPQAHRFHIFVNVSSHSASTPRVKTRGSR